MIKIILTIIIFSILAGIVGLHIGHNYGVQTICEEASFSYGKDWKLYTCSKLASFK